MTGQLRPAALPALDWFIDVLSANIELVTPTLVAVILGIGVGVCWFANHHKRRSIALIDEASQLVAGVERDQLWGRRSEISARAETSSTVVRDAWREFDETLVVDGQRLFNTVSAEEFFNEHRFASRLVGNRFLHVAPVALTTIGLLGTFLGLTVGLTALDLGSSADELRSGIQTLVHGAALGFTASLFGVSMSLVANVVERWSERAVVRKIQTLQATIDELFPMRSPEQSLSDIAASSKESKVALQELHEKIGLSLQESVKNVGDETSRAVSAAIHDSLAPIMADLAQRAANQSADVFKEISGQLTSSFGEIGREVALQLRESSESMRQTLDYMGEQLSRQADEHLAHMAELQRVSAAQVTAITEASMRQTAMLEESLPKVVGGLEQASTLIGTASVGMEAATENLSRVSVGLGEVSIAIGSTLADAARSMSELSGRAEAATTSLVDQQSAVRELTDRTVTAAKLLEEASRQLNGGFDGMRSTQDIFLKDLREQLTEHSRAMAGSFATYGDDVSKQTTHRMDEWNKHTEKFTSIMLNATQALSDAIDELGVVRSDDQREAVA